MTLGAVNTGSPMKTILVQFAEACWTSEAITQACIVARNSQARVIVLRLMQMPHAGYLGTDFGFVPTTARERTRLEDYRATAEDYGVELVTEAMQCISSFDALIQAVDHFGAEIVFAHFPRSWIPYWQRFQVWRAGQFLGSKLVTLDQPMPVPKDGPLTIEMITHPPLAGSLPPVR
jgi:hypothetical protein